MIMNLFIGDAFLGIVAVGVTFVIISGGIDLSVRSVIGFFLALAIERRNARLPLPPSCCSAH